MDLKNKLKGLPAIYYINLDNRTDRREYMESQFDYWGIKNYCRVSGTKYLASEYDNWKHLISNKKEYKVNPPYVANFVTHIEVIKNWLETTDEEYMIMMEDDYDLSLIEYWNFDWEYLMNHIPYDWDCIQLGFEHFDIIHFFLHPKLPKTYFGSCMINRHYAKKLVKLYIQDNKFLIDCEINNIKEIYETNFAAGTLDYSICNNGKVYCIPLIPQNPHYSSYENFISDENKIEYFTEIRSIYYDWWQYQHHKFSLKDFFTYGKPYDHLMTKHINFSINTKNKILSTKKFFNIDYI
jgi:hypothetical protein